MSLPSTIGGDLDQTLDTLAITAAISGCDQLGIAFSSDYDPDVTPDQVKAYSGPSVSLAMPVSQTQVTNYLIGKAAGTWFIYRLGFVIDQMSLRPASWEGVLFSGAGWP